MTGPRPEGRGKRSKSEVALIVLAVIVVISVLGGISLVVLFYLAMASYGSNK